MSVDREFATKLALAIAQQAAIGVKRYWEHGGATVSYKTGDDPVTLADKEANAFIVGELRAHFPHMPIVAEESDNASFAGFESEHAAWFVDPIDGTRDFVAKSTDFCVMIGLAEAGRATVGAIVCPADGRAFVGTLGKGAFEVHPDGTKTPVKLGTIERLADAVCVISKSHRTDDVVRELSKLGCKALRPVGSVGVKVLRVATGEADLYVHPTNGGMRWDSCAPEAIIRAAGGELTDARGQDLNYQAQDIANHDGLMAGNAALVQLAAAVLRGTS